MASNLFGKRIGVPSIHRRQDAALLKVKATLPESAAPAPASRQKAPSPADGYVGRAAEIERPQGKTADGLRRVVSLAEAKVLFDQLANAPDIPHDFIDEGCHLRAQVEAKRLEEAGVYSEKLFIVPKESDLRISSDRHPLGFTLAMFHTAPCISVELPGGTVEQRVIDPSLFRGPVPVETWAASMRGLNDKPCELVYLPRFAFHLMDRKEPPTAWRNQDLEDAAAWNTQYKELQQDMERSGFYEHLKELAGAQPR